ncbi:MAG: TfoX/Sxy family protein [Hyphomicrobiales bacterium]|nr:TfoX/Sxy family protein [Hyphomicrobiales bacterium]
MDAASITELFHPVGSVRLKRMFGGHGIYADALFFALESRGEIFLKTDAETQPAFAAAASLPFSFERAGKTMVTSYWRLPDVAFDDPDELVRWCRLAVAAARRASRGKRAPASPQKPVRPLRASRSSSPRRAKPR